jgi:hypothetical protein
MPQSGTTAKFFSKHFGVSLMVLMMMVMIIITIIIIIIIKREAMLQLMQLATGFAPCWPRFDSRMDHMEFAVVKVALG